jgi:glycosyltransferase involved in cell wall biosynthesis
MISVLTLTYKRHHLLEEAIQSFLLQDNPPEGCEMVIINDNSEVDYLLDFPNGNVRILNHKDRFANISDKLEWGYKQCKHDYIYRLDDDDLLAPWALKQSIADIENNPGYDIYRSNGMWFFQNNNYVGQSGNINNGNVYTKTFLNGIEFPSTSVGEDNIITFHSGGKIYESKLPNTMIYRWGMNTLHVSGMGQVADQAINDQADKVLNNTIGTIVLEPKFLNDYWTHLTET